MLPRRCSTTRSSCRPCCPRSKPIRGWWAATSTWKTSRWNVRSRRFGGLRDEEVSSDDLGQWQRHTSGDFRLEMLPGKHLFLFSDREPLLAVVRRDLEAALAAEMSPTAP